MRRPGAITIRLTAQSVPTVPTTSLGAGQMARACAVAGARLGPEPLTDAFDASYLYRVTRNRSAAIKLVLMEGGVVAGVGNIYANEALFAAGINPRTPARRVGLPRLGRLVSEVRAILARAIESGGSSLRDYVDSSGQAGHFQDTFRVYGREGRPCTACGAPVRLIRQGNRSTFYCVKCQR